MPLTTRYIAALHLARDAGMRAHEFYGHGRLMADAPAKLQEYATRCVGTLRVLIRDKLAAAFPGDAIIADGPAAASQHLPERSWIVEPIVGTRNFLRGIPFYAIALAYLEHDQCEIATVYDPEHDELFHARRGEGAFCEHAGGDTRLAVASCEKPHRALVCLADDDGAPDPAFLMIRHELMDLGVAVRALGADALALANVAAGRSDGFVGLHLDARRIAAGTLLVEEAGGCTLHGRHADGERAQAPLIACAPGIARVFSDLSHPWELRSGPVPRTREASLVH
jgi:myo-inositol-1(or 4)-monophosphatase